MKHTKHTKLRNKDIIKLQCPDSPFGNPTRKTFNPENCRRASVLFSCISWFNKIVEDTPPCFDFRHARRTVTNRPCLQRSPSVF